MADKIHYIPEGFTAVSPYVTVQDARKALEFYQKAFGATETFRTAGRDGRISHAQIDIDGSAVSLASPQDFDETLNKNLISLFLYVENVDQVVNQAVEAGATLLSSPEDQFYGDRSAGIVDPFGVTWWIATHIEDVTPDEMDKRALALGRA